MEKREITKAMKDAWVQHLLSKFFTHHIHRRSRSRDEDTSCRSVLDGRLRN